MTIIVKEVPLTEKRFYGIIITAKEKEYSFIIIYAIWKKKKTN